MYSNQGIRLVCNLNLSQHAGNTKDITNNHSMFGHAAQWLEHNCCSFFTGSKETIILCIAEFMGYNI